jgi:mono/diheme cytochrome c family protein
MRRLLGLALVAPLLAGCGWFGGWSSYPRVSTHSATVRVHPTAPANPVPRWVEVERLPQKAIRGAALFASAGCTSCHTYAGSGSANLGAPDLTAIGRRHLGVRFQIQHLRNPLSVTPGSPMPPFESLGRKRLRELAIFLEASKGIR